VTGRTDFRGLPKGGQSAVEKKLMSLNKETNRCGLWRLSLSYLALIHGRSLIQYACGWL